MIFMAYTRKAFLVITAQPITMRQLENRELIQVLVKAYNTTLTDYYYFPEVVFAGRQRIDKDAFEFLRAEGYIQELKHDSFGRFYKLTKKAEATIYAVTAARQQPKRKKRNVPASLPILFPALS